MNARLSAAENKNALWEGSLVVGRKPGSIVRGRAGRVLLISGLVIAAYVAFVGVRLFLFQPKQRVGRETTFVEGPLREDGTVDFAAALNEEWSKGVTPENNAAVSLMQAFGPRIITDEIQDEYFRLLKMETPPETGEYFVSLDEFIEREGIDADREWKLLEVRHSADVDEIKESYPELIHWAELNASALEPIVAATERSEFYLPIISSDPSGILISVELPVHVRCRDIATLLRVQGLMRLQEGDIEGAVRNAIAGHRLGRLIARHPALICFLVGFATDAVASQISEAIVLSGQLSPELAKGFQRELDSLPEFPDLTRNVDRGDRLFSLDTFYRLATDPEELDRGERSWFTPKLDPNVVLEEGNDVYDEWVNAMSMEDRSARDVELARLGDDVREMATREPNVEAAVSSALIGDQVGVTRQLSPKLIGLMFPAIPIAAEDRAIQTGRLVRLGAALAEYRAAEGEYPVRLEELQPGYVERLPVDLFSGEALKYRRVGEWFLLYSVGANGRDDGGWSLQEKGESDDVRFGVRPGEEEANTNGDEA